MGIDAVNVESGTKIFIWIPAVGLQGSCTYFLRNSSSVRTFPVESAREVVSRWMSVAGCEINSLYSICDTENGRLNNSMISMSEDNFMNHDLFINNGM